jgi:adenylosuccinate lyase
MREIWCEDSMIQKWLDFECSVSVAQAELGIIPKAVAREIARHCNTRVVAARAIAAHYKTTGHVIVSLVRAFRDAVPQAGESFHLGLTTQDVLDTGLTLQIRESLKLLIPETFTLQQAVLRNADKHRATVMMGRSEGQHGSPITFGYKMAVLASEITDHLDRLIAVTERLMVLTLFGATGVQSSFCLLAGKTGTHNLARLVGERLSLKVPVVCTHHRTDRFAELGYVLSLLLSTLGEAGLEIRDLQRTEVAEIAEPRSALQHSSSTMPQKQNPEISEWLDGLAKLAQGHALGLGAIRQQHERDITRLPPELSAIPNLFLNAMAAVKIAIHVLSGLRIDADRMRRNLTLQGGLAMSESVMLLLAKRSKRKVWAHQLCHDIASRVVHENKDFIAALEAHPDIKRYLKPHEIRQLVKPETYTGTAADQVQATIVYGQRKYKTLHQRFQRAVA